MLNISITPFGSDANGVMPIAYKLRFIIFVVVPATTLNTMAAEAKSIQYVRLAASAIPKTGTPVTFTMMVVGYANQSTNYVAIEVIPKTLEAIADAVERGLQWGRQRPDWQNQNIPEPSYFNTKYFNMNAITDTLWRKQYWVVHWFDKYYALIFALNGTRCHYTMKHSSDLHATGGIVDWGPRVRRGPVADRNQECKEGRDCICDGAGFNEGDGMVASDGRFNVDPLPADAISTGDPISDDDDPNTA